MFPSPLLEECIRRYSSIYPVVKYIYLTNLIITLMAHVDVNTLDTFHS